MQGSALNAVAMKLQSIAEAHSGSASRLANGRLVGTYAPPVGPGLPVTILRATATDAKGAFLRAGSVVSATTTAELSCFWRVLLAPRGSSSTSGAVRAHAGTRLSHVRYGIGRSAQNGRTWPHSPARERLNGETYRATGLIKLGSSNSR
jgi:hypothetical protein